ncbi:MAG TPA: YjbH domain-containing protein [Lunatimonas sp.]|nr:YjbH domain-containing protein [Lunatimonas sp.]
MGKPGLMFIPDASFEKDQFGLSFSHVPEAYAINYFMFGYYPENYISARAGILPFLEVNFTITRLEGMADRIGIGDRHLDVRLHLLKEKEQFPSIVLILSPLFGTANFIDHYALVMSKTYNLTGSWKFSPTFGYGLPYFVGLPPNSEDESFSERLKFHKKADYNNYYLNGFFGGAKFHHERFGGLMAEYDSRNVNVGVFVKLGNAFILQGHLIDFNSLSFTANFRMSLNKAPYEWRKHEKE